MTQPKPKAKRPPKPTHKAQKRSIIQREQDLSTIAKMYLTGSTQAEIGLHLGVTQQQISQDVKEIQKRWLDSSLRDFDELRAEQLAKIDRLETNYWAAWERSCRDRKRQRAGTKTDSHDRTEHAEFTTEGRDGNPAFLAGVDKCIERRCKLLGLDAPIKQDVTFHETLYDMLIASGMDDAPAESP